MAIGRHAASHAALRAFQDDGFRGNSPESSRFGGAATTLVYLLKTQLVEDAAGHFFDLRRLDIVGEQGAVGRLTGKQDDTLHPTPLLEVEFEGDSFLLM
jgi:hypothetical protein